MRRVPSDLPPPDHRLEPGHHPTPFSAAQIRAACGPGRRNEYRVTTADGASHHTVWWFEDGDADGATIARHHADLDGNPMTEVTRSRSSWLDLQRHASYPAATTQIEHGEITTPAGTFACWCYVAADGDDVTRAWFARSLPGPPVLVTTTRDGVAVFRSELVAVTDPRTA